MGHQQCVILQFTWSFYGDLLIILPLSLWNGTFLSTKKDRFVHLCGGNHTIFKFYFTYYQAIVLGIYFILRVVFQYRHDIVSRWQNVIY